MEPSDQIALASVISSAAVAVVVPLATLAINTIWGSRKEHQRWLREQRAGVYVDLLTESKAEHYWQLYATGNAGVQETMARGGLDQMRLPEKERIRLTAKGKVFGAPDVQRALRRLDAAISATTVETAAGDVASMSSAWAELSVARLQLENAIQRDLRTDVGAHAPTREKRASLRFPRRSTRAGEENNRT